MQEKPRLRLVSSHKSANLEETLQGFASDLLNESGEDFGSIECAEARSPVTIDLGANDIAALKRILATLAKDVPHATVSSDGRAEREIAQLIFDLRKARALLFPASMFGEPAWDMMMALYIANQAPAAADLARWTNTPPTTAMRWITYLEGHDLVARESSDDDRRTHKIRLTRQARVNMQQLFSDFLGKYR